MGCLRTMVWFSIVLFLVFSGGWCGEEDEEEISGTIMAETEQEALYSAIQGFVGNDWNGTDLYPDPCGWTPIPGMACDLYDDLWYVTALSFGPMNDNSLICDLNVEFTPHLFSLKHLKSLIFYKCFNSSSPVTIPSRNWEVFAESMEYLEFRSNPGLIGQTPRAFGQLKKLTSLVLMDNGLSGHLPQNLDNLTELKQLVLAGNKFSGQIPDNFGGFSKLLIMDLSRNSLFGTLPLTFGGLTSLLKLDLSRNQLSGTVSLGDLKNLTLLDLSNNNLSGGLDKSFEEMSSLTDLVLSNNPLMGGNLTILEWHKMKTLVTLELSNTGLTGQIPESISELKGVWFMGLGNNNLTGEVPSKLESMPCVAAMYLNGNNLKGQLNFTKSFYEKLGRRFGAWNNSNLCYPSGLMSKIHAPFGVKACDKNGWFA